MKAANVVMALVGGACLALLAVACQGGEEAAPATPVPGITDTEIILGADAPLTGAYGAVYAMLPRATEAYFRYVNETQGGVCGRKIVYKVEDNYYDPAKALEAVRKLVEQDKVFAIVGSLGDLPHSGVWDYLNDNGVPDLLVSAGAHKFGADFQGHPFTFQMLGSFKIAAMLGGQYISAYLPGKKVGLLSETTAGDDAAAGLRQGLDPAKNELVSEQTYEATAIDVRSQVINLYKAGAEVVVLGTSPGFLAQAVKEADRLGWHPQFLAASVSADEIIFQFVSPQLLEGMVTSQSYKLASWTDDPDIAAHRELMQKYDGPSPTNFSVYAQSLAELTVEILSRTCDNLTREGLLESIKSIKKWHSSLLLDGVNITFGEKDHTAIQGGRALKAVIEDGEGKFEYFGTLVTTGEEDPQ